MTFIHSCPFRLDIVWSIINFMSMNKNTKIKCITYFLLSVFWQFHYKTMISMDISHNTEMMLKSNYPRLINFKSITQFMIKIYVPPCLTILSNTPFDVELLELVKSSQYTGTSDTSEDVGSSSLHQGHESFILDDLHCAIN